MFDTSSQSFQRQDDQEVRAISCVLSEADEMQYIGTPRVFLQVSLFFSLGERHEEFRMICIAHLKMTSSMYTDFDIRIFF